MKRTSAIGQHLASVFPRRDQHRFVSHTGGKAARRFRAAKFEWLEPPTLLSAAPWESDLLPANVASQLAGPYWEMIAARPALVPTSETTGSSDVTPDEVLGVGKPNVPLEVPGLLQWDEAGRVLVDVWQQSSVRTSPPVWSPWVRLSWRPTSPIVWSRRGSS